MDEECRKDGVLSFKRILTNEEYDKMKADIKNYINNENCWETWLKDNEAEYTHYKVSLEDKTV